MTYQGCQCGRNNTCISISGEENKCNCDAQLGSINEDVGIITAMDVLPISAFEYGPYKVEGNHPEIRIGKLKCVGRKKAKVFEIHVRTSCANQDGSTWFDNDPIVQICQGKSRKCFI